MSINTLYKYTALQSSFSVNNIALVNGRPEMLNLKDMIHHFVEHRHEVVVRRTKYELRKAEERAHILEGLIIASDNIDEVIALIRASSNADEAREKLMERFKLTEIQAKAIVEMRLRQLTGLEQDKLRAEYDEIIKTIADLKDIVFFPFRFVLTLNKLPDKGYFFISLAFMPLRAVEIKSSLLLEPPKVQFVIFLAGRLIWCILLPLKS